MDEGKGSCSGAGHWIKQGKGMEGEAGAVTAACNPPMAPHCPQRKCREFAGLGRLCSGPVPGIHFALPHNQRSGLSSRSCEKPSPRICLFWHLLSMYCMSDCSRHGGYNGELLPCGLTVALASRLGYMPRFIFESGEDIISKTSLMLPFLGPWDLSTYPPLSNSPSPVCLPHWAGSPQRWALRGILGLQCSAWQTAVHGIKGWLARWME